jgi:hypothetical protein
MEFFIHQDRIFWDSIQLLFTIQAAVLAAGYALRSTWLSFVVLIGGTVITILLFMLVLKVEWDRDVNLPLMDKLAELLIPQNIKRQLRMEGKKTSVVFWAATRSYLRFIRGRIILRSVLIGLIVIDIIFAVLLLPPLLG